MRVVLNQGAIAALASDPDVLASVGDVADAVAEVMAEGAPKDTGDAARSIHAEPDDDEPGFRVSWDQEHYYLRFHEEGTEKMPARPFARPAADLFRRR